MLCRYLFIISIMLAPLANAAENTENVRRFVEDLSKKVEVVINSNGSTLEDRRAKLQEMFLANVDVEWMAKFVLGRGWQSASKEQQARYVKAYRNYVLMHYTKNFTDYTGSQYQIIDVINEGEGEFTVNMQIHTPKKDMNTNAGYRIRTVNGEYKIINIIVEGVSMLATQRSDFTSVLQRKGMDGLISDIEMKTRINERG